MSKWTNCIGTWNFSNAEYVGEYKDGNRHGQGTITYDDGNKYVGEFEFNYMTGQGTFTYTNGDKYVGEWKMNKMHGQGTHTYANGKIKRGIWEKGKLVKRIKISEEEKAESREDKKIVKAKNVCRKIGFTPGTDKFLDCTVKMLTTTGGKQTVIVGNQRKSIYPLHCRQMGGASAC